MTTPLQKAAQELIDRIADLGASPLDWAEYTALEAALEAEQEQAVEPLLWVRKDQLNQMASGFLLSAYRSTEGRTDLTPVFAHPAPPADDFDTWQKNPYTLVLQKSIAEDYVPKKAQQVAVPPGYALVPIEPTPAILDAMSSSGWKTACYKAMLAAAQGAKP